jgi:hypothetical protein
MPVELVETRGIEPLTPALQKPSATFEQLGLPGI